MGKITIIMITILKKSMTSKTYLKSIEIASYVYKKAFQNNFYIDIYKCQAIVFACYGTFLTFADKQICEKPNELCVFKELYKFSLDALFSDRLIEMDDKVEDTFSKEEIELLDKTIDFFKDHKSYQLMTLFRKTIKNESDIKDLFLYIVD